MMSRRIAQQTLRQLTAQQPALRFASPAAVAMGATLTAQRRYAAAHAVDTTTVPADQILAKQRLNRPVAPHLGIYKPQITWYLSGFNRLTGCILSGGFYAYGALYLVAPYLGWHVESSVLAASFAAWPVALKFATKFLVAFPFTFHVFNGFRHLIWDTVSMMTNKAVNQSGWFVVGLTVLGSVGLALW
ncbi:hypothetical protein AMS68_007147 [Peltaster fructicola]|uniref:Uncharacterized protein n=1 Tax=Peltaster fructicola TaxID=286661 RepID=A0A6H0Y4U4_9PEZI|nr:hypothetical protein AMS68_007147 [Peltaster fructicola]